MKFFGNLSIAKRLYLLNIVAAIGLIILSAITIYHTAIDLKTQKNSELKHLTETAVAVTKGFHAQAEAGKLTEEQAVTTNLIKVTAASMKCWFTVMEDSMTLLMEQHEKTSRLIKSITNITNQVILNDVEETIKMTKGNDNIKQAIGKCKACKVDFLGPTCARDTSKTYYKTCSACYQPKPRRK